jgi:hypothetical protein
MTRAHIVDKTKATSAAPAVHFALKGKVTFVVPAAIARSPEISATTPPDTPTRLSARLRTFW